jgi:agmatine deiminase
MTTPSQSGFFMPPEWAPHDRCWMAWPCRADLWGDEIDDARAEFADVARAISSVEQVTMVARPDDVVQASLKCGAGVEVVPMELNDSWMRDIGPVFVSDGRGQLAGVHWRFNGWGGSYEPYDADARVGGEILHRLRLRRFDAPLVLEGGAISVDGEGTCLATEQCLLNSNRNPELSRREIEEYLQRFLGITKVIWLERGLVDDETDGHVDNVAVFARSGVVLVHDTEDTRDANHDIVKENFRRLGGATDARGQELEVIALPQPKARKHKGKRLPMSYVNHYIANDTVFVPAYDDSADDKAAAILERVYPERAIRQIHCETIVKGGGSIHCITMQQPSATI